MGNDLGIQMASDLLNFETTQITQPPKFKSTKMRILLVKMAKFVGKKASNCLDNWNGEKKQSWTEMVMGSNRLSVIHVAHPIAEQQINMDSTVEAPTVCWQDKQQTDKQTNAIQIIGHKLSLIGKLKLISALPPLLLLTHCQRLNRIVIVRI